MPKQLNKKKNEAGGSAVSSGSERGLGQNPTGVLRAEPPAVFGAEPQRGSRGGAPNFSLAAKPTGVWGGGGGAPSFILPRGPVLPLEGRIILGQTCCKYFPHSGQAVCCDLPNAVCCSGNKYCCPYGYRCAPHHQCIHTANMLPLQEYYPFTTTNPDKFPTTTKVPTGTTE